MSLTGRLRRRRRTAETTPRAPYVSWASPAAAEPPSASERWRATVGELARAVLSALGVTHVPRPTVGPPLERICADLHRIHGEINRVLDDPRIPARYHRLVAATWAYDAALVDACRAIGVPPPQARPLDNMGRLEAEAALTAHGVHW